MSLVIICNQEQNKISCKGSEQEKNLPLDHIRWIDMQSKGILQWIVIEFEEKTWLSCDEKNE